VNLKSYFKRYSIWALLFLFVFIYAFISVHKYEHFQSFAWDLAFFDELIWKQSVGLLPISSLVPLHVLGDHFQPVILLFSLVYKIVPDVRTLLIGQAFIAVLSAYPIYLLALKVLVSKYTALVITFTFLLFTGFQFAVFDGFHQSVFSAFFLGWLYFFLERKNWFGLGASVIGLLLTKEEYALLLSALGLTTFFFYGQKKLGISLIVTGFTSFFIFIYIIIPFFQQGTYTHFGYGELGATPQQVLYTAITQPIIFIKLLVWPPVKLTTVLESFFAFGFFPLLSPIHLIPIFQQYAVRFADTVTTHRWTNLNHYAFPLSPLLAVATIYGLRSFQNRFGKLALWTTVLLISVLSQNFFSHGPINSLFKPDFFQVTYWEKDAHELVKQVPPDVVIASQNSLLPHLAHRPKYYLLPEIGNADFIAVDLANGPNKYSPLNYTTFNDLIENLLVTNQYKIRWRRRDSLLLERVN